MINIIQTDYAVFMYLEIFACMYTYVYKIIINGKEAINLKESKRYMKVCKGQGRGNNIIILQSQKYKVTKNIKIKKLHFKKEQKGPLLTCS